MITQALKVKMILAATGLSARQASRLLGVSEGSVRAWALGARAVPYGALERLSDYYAFMRRWADEHSQPIDDLTTDEELLQQGFYSVASYRIAAAMIVFK